MSAPLSNGQRRVDPYPGNDNGSLPAPRGGLAADTIMALRFFSRLPTGASPHERPDLNRIAWALPFANLIIGAFPALILVGLIALGLPALFVVVLACLVLVALTGAMSEDAVADAADGLAGGTTALRRLEILRDSRHGTYGVLAIVFLVLLRVSTLVSIAAISPFAAALCWLAATGLARSASLYPAFKLDPARPDGAAATAVRLRRNGMWGGLAFAVILTLVLAGGFAGLSGVVLGVGIALLLAIVWTRMCRRLVGGVTGDLIGALQAVVEIGVLATYMLMIVRF